MKSNQITKFLEQHYKQEQIHKIIEYVKLIEHWRKYINIVGKNENIWERHIADCTWFVPHMKKFIGEETTIADLGAGAGLPGVVLSCLLDRKITLIEATEKKCKFLEEVKQLDIPIEILCSRIEHVSSSYDVLTARALAPLDQLIKLAQPLLNKNGVCFFQKGKNVQEEIKKTEKKNSINYQKILSDLSEGGCLLVIRGIKEKGSSKNMNKNL